VARGYAKAGAVVVKDFVEAAQGGDWFISGAGFFDYLRDIVAMFEADDSIDSCGLIEQPVSEALWEAAGDDDLFD